MVGRAGGRSRQAARIMDLSTLNPVAKPVLVEHYGEGTWLVLKCDRPVRLRVSPIDGISTVSAAMVSKDLTQR